MSVYSQSMHAFIFVYLFIFALSNGARVPQSVDYDNSLGAGRSEINSRWVRNLSSPPRPVQNGGGGAGVIRTG
jgi:hypothetical protein